MNRSLMRIKIHTVRLGVGIAHECALDDGNGVH